MSSLPRRGAAAAALGTCPTAGDEAAITIDYFLQVFSRETYYRCKAIHNINSGSITMHTARNSLTTSLMLHEGNQRKYILDLSECKTLAKESVSMVSKIVN